MAMREFCTFIKIGEKRFMEKLFHEGEVFCKPIQYFNSIEQKDLRLDPHDGAAFIKQVMQITLSINNKVFAEAASGQHYLRHPDDQGNIFCLYAIPSETLDLTSQKLKRFNLNMESIDFGDTALIIYDLEEFLNRIKRAVEERGFIYQDSPVVYYDEKEYEGELNPFYKSKKYELQNEFRIWIPNKQNEDLRFKIGSISDISHIMPKSEISGLSYSPVV